MNTVVDIRHENPATLARQEHEAALRALDIEEAGLRANIARVEAARRPITTLIEQRTRIKAQLAEVHAAAHLGDPSPHDADALRLQLSEVELELDSQEDEAGGADIALARLHDRIADVQGRRSAGLTRLTLLRREEIDARLAALALEGEFAVQPYLAHYIEMGAVAAVRDRLKLPSEPWCADVFGKGKLAFPAPFGIKAFGTFAADRDLRPQIEARAQQLLREIGAS